MATTQLTTCDNDGCKSVKSPKNEKEWTSAYKLEDDMLLFGPLQQSNADTYEFLSAGLTAVDFCSPKCAYEYTAGLLGWKKPGRPKGSKNKPKEQATA